MSSAPHSDEERRQEADRSAMQALSRLQSSGDGARTPALPHAGEPDNHAPQEAKQAPINPLLVLLDFFIAFGLTIMLQIPLVLILLGTRADLRELVQGGSPEALQQALFTPSFFIAATLIQALVFLLVVIVRTVVLNRRGWHWLGISLSSLSLSSLGWGLLGGVLFLAVNIMFGLAAQAIGLQPPDQQRMFPLDNASTAGIVAIAFGVVVLAPISEELFFRAYAQRSFVERFGSVPGVLIGAVLFTLPHLLTITQGFVVLLAAVFAGGVILGWVYWYTRSIAASIVAHAINNSVAFLAILVAPQIEGLP